MDWQEHWTKIAAGVLLGVLLAGAYIAYSMFWSISYENGLLEDNKYGYAIQYPATWKEIEGDEKDQITDQVKYDWDTDFRFAATPSSIQREAVVIFVVDKEEVQDPKFAKDVIVKSIGSDVELDETVQINGIEVNRVGFSVRDLIYLELVLFALEDHIVVMQYVALEPVSEEFFKAVDESVASIRKL